jgi:murein DD-endopeptidase MepM/ murein hydrolase activator NlpD
VRAECSQQTFLSTTVPAGSTIRKLRSLVARCFAIWLFAKGRRAATAPPPAVEPLVRVVDLNIGESAEVTLANGSKASVRLVAIDERRDSIRQAIRKAEVTVEVDGVRYFLISGNYRLPEQVGPVQIDCPVTKAYHLYGVPKYWGLDKDARLRLWPAGSPWLLPNSFIYPVRQRWFASATQMSNEPAYVDGGEPATLRPINYHSGLDLGGSDGQTEVVAATDGLIVSAGNDVLAGYWRDSPVLPRYDVVYLLDGRGWFYRYSHFHHLEPGLVPGRLIKQGQPLGVLGKEGGSGGWSHLHFEILSRQPSGKWGTLDGYAFLWEAYLRQYPARIIAVARPHFLIRSGEWVELDGTRSWCQCGSIVEYRWLLSNGQTGQGARFNRTYDRPGEFSEVLEVRDSAGNVARDFTTVLVHDAIHPEIQPATLHAAFFPTQGIRPGDSVTFKVRSFRKSSAGESWDFGDGTPPVTVHSDGNARHHAPDGYAVTTHRFERPGEYLVSVRRLSGDYPALAHLNVIVGD